MEPFRNLDKLVSILYKKYGETCQKPMHPTAAIKHTDDTKLGRSCTSCFTETYAESRNNVPLAKASFDLNGPEDQRYGLNELQSCTRPTR